jgi:hypothetical protein
MPCARCPNLDANGAGYHPLPPWSHVAYDDYQWLEDGTWAEIHDCLCEEIRIKLGHDAEPRVTMIDSPSVKTVSQGAERGYAGAKQGKGRNRHLRVDTLGLLVLLMITAASAQASEGDQKCSGMCEHKHTACQKCRLIKAIHPGLLSG